MQMRADEGGPRAALRGQRAGRGQASIRPPPARVGRRAGDVGPLNVFNEVYRFSRKCDYKRALIEDLNTIIKWFNLVEKSIT
jgi:hypothetical protein